MKRAVEFIDVGRGKRSWTANIDWTEAAVIKEVRRSGALMSQNIGAELGMNAGVITAGFHTVGGVRLIEHEVSLSA